VGDDAREPGEGFYFWHCTLELTEAGLGEMDYVIETVYRGLAVLRAASAAERERTYDELRRLTRVQWDHRDREDPPAWARTLALRQHHHAPEELLREPSLLLEYDAQACDRLLRVCGFDCPPHG
jgi:secreted Zn-dependent insulinase-like peptidase